MPHLARPTSSIRGNRSTGVQRFVAWPQKIAVSLRLIDQATSIDRERVSTTGVRGWDHESIRTRMIDPTAHADGADLMTRHSTVYCLALTVPSRAGARLVDRIAVKDSSRGQSAAAPPDHAPGRIVDPERVKQTVRPLQGRNECVPDGPWARRKAIESQPFRLLTPDFPLLPTV